MPWRAFAGRRLGLALCFCAALLLFATAMLAGHGATVLAPAAIGAAALLAARFAFLAAERHAPFFGALAASRTAPSVDVPLPGGAAFERKRFGLLAEEIGVGPAHGLVEVFLGDTAERLAAMRSLVAAGERKTLARAAHSLKSSAGTFGFGHLAALAREIESAASSAPEPRLLALTQAAAEALEGGRRAWRAAM